ncbi:MAG: class B sortase [Ruminococcus sp.]|uniref:class B sortase n=1 Tax=Ruminococcus sp. TaxID=41978 RepID=UPI0025D7E474|nr:class B sortase [Ruminococcus sp.]MBR6995765.1 class B sortase [Ruminococcus sp.]
MNKKNILRIAAAVSAALLLGGFYVYFKDDIAQDKAENDLLPFKPIMVSQGTLDEITDDLMETTAADTTAVNVRYTTANEAPVTASDTIPDEVRHSLMESAQSLNEAYPDVIGWLYIPNTNISYPVTQGRDNEYYLSHAYDGSSLKAGTIFLDCRCENRFMNPVNILYGHSMKNGTMFAGVLNFADSSYFESHRYGWLATPETVYRIDFFSCAKTDCNDELYDGNTPISEWIPHICEKSVVLKETEYADNDRFISLSTCSYEFKNARTVLTGRLVEMTGGR